MGVLETPPNRQAGGALRRGIAWLVFACLLLALGSAQALRRDHYFNRLGNDLGLAQQSIQALIQDEQGFIWVATQAGLQRFDGYQFQTFGDGESADAVLPEGFITALASDGHGRLWTGSINHFVNGLDLRSGRVLPGPLSGDPLRDRVLALRALPDGSVWVATMAGVERFEPDSGERSEVLRWGLAADAGELGNVIRRAYFALDPDGGLLAVSDSGLHRIDTTSRAHRLLISRRDLVTAHRDRQDRIWVGGLSGLYRLSAEGELSAVADAGGRPLPGVRRLVDDAQGRLWMSVWQGGLLVFDPADGSHFKLDADPRIPGSLHDSQIASLLMDTGGLLWTGGESMGIATVAVDGTRFSLLLKSLQQTSGPTDNSVRVLARSGPDHIWAGHAESSLRRFNPGSGESEEFFDVLLAASGRGSARPVGRRRVIGIAELAPDRVWVSSDIGLYELDPTQRRARRLTPLDDHAQPWRYREMLLTRAGTVWLGTSDAGVLAYSPATRSWRRFPPEPGTPGSLGNSNTLNLFEDRQGRVWIATLDGLFLIEADGERVRRFAHDRGDPQSLAANLVRAMDEDAGGRLWVASHGGLQYVVEDADGGIRFQRHPLTRQMPDRAFYGVLGDARGRLWISSNLGVSRLDETREEVLRFGVADGLQSQEFNGGAQLRLDDGRLLFAGMAGINLFDPAGIEASDYTPPLAITRIQTGAQGEPRSLAAPLASLELAQDDRILRLRFAALDFFDPLRNRFQYRLEGFDKDWVMRDNTPEATYTNLAPGRYTLRVRASNHDGVWSERELALPVKVTPVWWNSTPARLGYLLATALLAGALWTLQQRRRRQERALLREIAEREERFKLALWGSGDEFWDWDVRSDVLHRIGADQLLGRRPEESMSADEWRHRAVHPDDRERVLDLLHTHIDEATPAFESEHRVRNAHNDWVWVRSRGKVVERDAQGVALRIAGTARDISVIREAESERRVASEVLRSMNEAVAVVDLDFRFVSVNPAFSRITGYAEAEVIGQPSSLIDSAQQDAGFYSRLRTTTMEVGHWKGEIWQRRKSGEEFLSWIDISEVRDQRGERTHFVAVVDDITDRKRTELELRYLANYDILTGLPNRALLSERLARAITRARRQQTRVALLFLDLDRFKDVNDSLGHAIGDRVLKAAAARLQETVRDTDTVARLGGDEFTVVLEDIDDIAAAEDMAVRIGTAFARPLGVDSRAEATISPSIGIAVFPDHAATPVDLLKFADTAMYQAKDRGRNTWQTYTEAMDAETRRRASMLAALRKALDRGEFSLLFQPKLSLLDHRISGVEALLRWHSDELGHIGPATFIPLAEETGLIVPIGEWVLREAANTLARWRRAGCDDLVMAVNISVLQLLRGDLPGHVAGVLEEFDLPANRLELEVTESMVMANAEQAIRAMRELKSLGVSLAIDDFGTGYSSLIYLKRLPIDTLKIDKAFVGDLTTDPDDEAITATIVTMAHSLGLNVVAEGVETVEQVQYLLEQGCDEIQGYWLARPLDASRCLEFMRDWNPAAVQIPGQS